MSSKYRAKPKAARDMPPPTHTYWDEKLGLYVKVYAPGVEGVPSPRIVDEESLRRIEFERMSTYEPASDLASAGLPTGVSHDKQTN